VLRNVFLNLLFPRRCVVCRKELGAADVCGECVANIPVFGWLACIRCGRRLPDGRPCPLHRYRTPIEGIAAATDYGRKDVRLLIHTYKYRGRRALAEPLADLLIRHAASAGFAELLASREATVVPIPLASRRAYRRGFNQSALIAERFARHFGLAYQPDFLERPLERAAQVTMADAGARRKNIKGVFRIGVRPERIRGRTVLLVDDVASSGATLEEAGRTLKAAGAKTVWVMVIARGV
jgi:ComF family protein